MIREVVSSAGFVRHLVRRSGWMLVVATALAVVTTMTEGVGVLLLLPMINVVGIDTSAVGFSEVSGIFHRLIDAIGLSAELGPILCLFFAAVVLHELVGWGRRVASVHLLSRLGADLRGELFTAIAHSQWAFFCRERGTTRSCSYMIYAEYTMKSTRNTTLLTLIFLLFMGMTPLLAESVTIGSNGDLSLNRPFCGT